MSVPAIDPAWIALIGTLCGGLGLKITEHLLGRRKIKIDDAAKIRDELRIEITAQREEIKSLEAEVEKWRSEYYNLSDQQIKMQTELMIALQRIKDETPPPNPDIDNIVP